MTTGNVVRTMSAGASRLFAVLWVSSATGCSQVFTIKGFSIADPVVDTAKHWPAGTLLPGWGIPGYLGKDCDTSISAWCDPNGNWGVADRIRNRADAHSFQTGIEFGHVDHHDFATYVAIATHATDFVTVAKGEDRQTSATGSADPAIAASYDRINIARPILTIDGSVGLPISFKTSTNLSCTPSQPAR